MKTTLGLLILHGTAASSFAARPTIGHQPFPDQFQQHPCAPGDACGSMTPGKIVDVASTMRGFILKQEWVDAHWKEMMELMRPTCRKLGTCYATPGNGAVFCMDLLFPEFWSVCNRYPESSDDYQQCAMFTRIFSMRADLRDKKIWKEAQACSAAQAQPGQAKTMKVWMTPDRIGEDYGGRFVVYAADAATNVPIQALVSMKDVRLRARAPGGKPWTNYEIAWDAKMLRVPNGDGHTDLAAPQITVSAEGFAPVTLAMPMTAGKVTVEMSPAAKKLKPGKNRIVVTARDAQTGKPVELRVMLGETILGDTNEPLVLELAKGQKRPELWATSLFDKYSDVVIAPAEK